MSYGELVSVSVEVDTSELDSRLDDVEEKLRDVESMDSDGVQALIDSAFDASEFIKAGDIDFEGLERRVEDLENARLHDPEALERRLEALERTRAQESTVIDLLRQLARALIG
jgi:hypothetical protein